MTPVQASLVLLVIILFCYIMDTKNEYEWVKVLGGLCFILEFVVAIWAIFHYL